MALPPHLSALLSSSAYAHPVTDIRLVETHISWILLTGDLAYKIKRPVHYPFIDMRSMDRRAFLCAEEVRLNRRFAPGLYLDVVPITSEDGKTRMGGAGDVIDHAVLMRQFQRDDELDRLLARADVAPAELASFGRSLARVHASLPSVDAAEPFGHAAYVRASLLENLEQCVQVAERASLGANLHALGSLIEDHFAAVEALVASRRDSQRVRECHGDLHARNVIRYEGGLTAFDCLEFEPAYRWIDVAEDVAFLFMDLLARDAPMHAAAFLNGYLGQCGDFQACRLIHLYGAHRAIVRAKVAALEAAAANDSAERAAADAAHRLYLNCAARLLESARPSLVLMSGLSGSGKTWLAEHLALSLKAVHLRSDVERKRLAGIPEHASSGSGMQGGLYTLDMSARVHGVLAEGAADALAGGFSAIVDATFNRREDRATFVMLASRCGLPVTLIHCHAPLAVLELRIIDRARRGDASEANLSVLHWQQAHEEPVGVEEGLRVIEADTTRQDVVPAVLAALGVA